MTSAQEDSMTSPQRSLAGGLLLTSILLLLFFTPTDSFAIPVFARKYGLPCSACHEAWPKLNSFGQKFKDEGYQLRNEKDAPIWLRPEFWPVAMRITPHWHFESAGRTPVDSAPSGEQTINTSGFDLTGIDILTGGTLANNISFLLVPSIDVGSGTVGFESANVRLDNLWGSPWLNFKFGKFEQDVPLSEKRMMTLSNVGGAYQLYHFVPPGDANTDEFASLGENQLGIELMGHSEDDHTRFAVSLLSSTNGTPGLPFGRSYDGYLHLSQGFLVPHLGLQREVRNQEALAEVKVTVVASSKWQPRGTVSATQERNRKPGVVVFGMAHQLNAELVFTKAGRSVIVGIARRYEVIKLVGATHVSKRHHALFGKGQILLELAEPEVQPRRSPEIVQPHVSRFKSNSAGTHIN